MAEGDLIKEHLISFAVGVIRAHEAHPVIPGKQQIRKRLSHDGILSVVNCVATRIAKGTKIIVYTPKSVNKETIETRTWLSIFVQGELVSA